MFVKVQVTCWCMKARMWIRLPDEQVPAGATSSYQPLLSGRRHEAFSAPHRPASHGYAPSLTGRCPVSPPQSHLSAGHAHSPDGYAAY